MGKALEEKRAEGCPEEEMEKYAAAFAHSFPGGYAEGVAEVRENMARYVLERLFILEKEQILKLSEHEAADIARRLTENIKK